MKARSVQSGVTLVELVVTIVVVSVAVAAVLGVLTMLSSRSADAMVRDQAAAIASAYLEEIRSRAFDHTSGQTARLDFDDVDDYDGLVDVGAHDQDGNAVTGLDQYRVSVSVVSDASLPATAASDVRRIDVTVVDAAGVTVTMSGYKLKLP